MAHFFVYFGEKYHNESHGAMGRIVNETTMKPSTWDEAAQMLESGAPICIRKADAAELEWADTILNELQMEIQSAAQKREGH